MKKLIQVAGLCVPVILWGQSVDLAPVWTIRNNPFALAQGQVIGAGEFTLIAGRKFGIRESVWLGTGFSYLTFIGKAFWKTLLEESINNPNVQIDITKGLGFRIIASQRWYFDRNGHLLEGFHFGPLLSAHFFYLHFDVDSEPFVMQYRIFNFILPVGYTTYLSDFISLDALFGYNYRLHLATISYKPRRWINTSQPLISGHWIWFSLFIRFALSYSE